MSVDGYLRRQRILIRIGMVAAAAGLAFYWWKAIVAAQEDALFVHQNYWNAPIGTITLFILLVVLTPAWLWWVLKHWNWAGFTRDDD